MTSLKSVRLNTQLDAEAQVTQLKALSDTYLNGTSGLKTLKSVEVLGKELVACGDWLKKHRAKATSNKALTRPPVPAAQQTTTTISRLWDNLFAYEIVGGVPEVKQAIMSALLANHYIKKEAQQATDLDFQRLFGAEILLPKSVFPLPRKAVSQPAIPNSASNLLEREITTEEDNIKRLLSAIDDLKRLHGIQLEEARNVVNPTQASAPSEGLDTILDTRNLLADTLTLLTDLRLSTRQRIHFLIGQIGIELKKSYSRLSKLVKVEQAVLSLGGALWIEKAGNNNAGPIVEPVHPKSSAENAYDGFYPPDGICRAKPLGIGDFLKVEQELCCYKPGEVAHIENVMAREYKERATRRLRRIENTLTTTSEKESLKERDTTSTDRFEMEREVSKVIEQDYNLHAGVNITKHGPVSVNFNAGFAASYATQESNTQATRYGKEVTDRALERITERVREERVTKILEEFEESNKHGFDNRGGDAHVVGLYRWADKIYKARVVNYGKRLMYEFMIPEPAAFHLWAMAKPAAELGGGLTMPNPPSMSSHVDINRYNYGALAAQYGAITEAPPAELTTVERIYAPAETPDSPINVSVSYNDIKVPDGYQPYIAYIQARLYPNNHVSVYVGQSGKYLDFSNCQDIDQNWLHLTFENEVDVIPVGIVGLLQHYIVSVNIRCKLTEQAYETWQLKTFAAIIGAYEQKKALFETALAEAKARRGYGIGGTNPTINRQIEQQELKKACISSVFSGADFSSNAVAYQNASNDWLADSSTSDCMMPLTRYNCQNAEIAERANFLEQCFEWDIMTYQFLPYFYGQRCRWRKIYQLNDADPLFLSFLQAGMARVVVPVRPGYERASMYLLSTGQFTSATEIPLVDSHISRAIMNDLKKPADPDDPSLGSWEVRVPTSLTVLQCGSGCVEGDGLPCDCGPGVFGVDKGGRVTGLPNI